MPPLVYSPRYSMELGTHVFQTRKYSLVHDLLIEARVAAPQDFVEPEAASWEDLALVHLPEYLERIRTGQLDEDEQAQLEIRWSPEVVEGFRRMVGGTILAAQLALCPPPPPLPAGQAAPCEYTHGVGINLGGGFHHASEDHGEGFCLFNDVAVAIRVLKRDRRISRAAVVDCDVHQGNGTAIVFTGDRSVFTFSIHQEHNYPTFKPVGSLDVHLPDYTEDEAYLRQLAGALQRVLASDPDILFYLAGADPYERDQLGGLSLTKEGLRRRDRMVFTAAAELHVPVAVTLAGGYARFVEDTAEIHAATVEEAVRIFGV